MGTVLPYLLLAISPLCWAGNIVLARGMAETIAPVAFAFWRWAIAFMIILPFAWRHARRDWPAVVKNWRILFLLSLTGISIFNTLLYKAVHTTTAINGALIQTSMPAVIILISLVSFNEKVTLIQIFGVSLCVLGAGVVVLQGKLTTFLQLTFVEGDVLMLAAVIVYAYYSANLRRRPPIHPFSFLAYTFGIGACGLFPVYLWEITQGGLFTLNLSIVSSILYVALFPSIIAYFCWNRGVEIIGANRAGLFINLIPVFASVLAVIWLGENIKAYHVVGLLMIFSGMILFNR